MARSMTGYGRARVEGEGMTQTWEIKSVNSRYLDLKWRLPPQVRSLETDFERTVRKFAGRGRVELNLNLDTVRPELLGVSFNTSQAEAMLTQLEHLAKKNGVAFIPDFKQDAVHLLPVEGGG